MMTAVHAAAIDADRRSTRDNLHPLEVTAVQFRRRKAMFCCAGEHRQTALRQLFIALALLIVSVSPAFAQLDRATISGTIKDAQGGVMPGVTVTAVSTQTKQERTTVTDASGFYTFANMQPGIYDI